MEDNTRERFEAWWQTVSKGKSTPPRYKEGYVHDNPNLAWVAWQAASARNDVPVNEAAKGGQGDEQSLKALLHEIIKARPPHPTTKDYHWYLARMAGNIYDLFQPYMNKPEQQTSREEELVKALHANDHMLRIIGHRDARWCDDELMNQLLERNKGVLLTAANRKE